QERLPRARRADKEHALRDLRAQPRELPRRPQELDDLLQLLLRLVRARDIREGDARALLAHDLRAVLADRHHALRGVDATQHPDPEEDEEPQREEPAERLAEPPVGPPLVGDVVRIEERDQALVVRDPHRGHRPRHPGRPRAVRNRRADHVPADHDRVDLTRLDPALQLAVRDPRRILRPEDVVEDEEDRQREQEIEDRETGPAISHRTAGPTVRRTLTTVREETPTVAPTGLVRLRSRILARLPPPRDEPNETDSGAN